MERRIREIENQIRSLSIGKTIRLTFLVDLFAGVRGMLGSEQTGGDRRREQFVDALEDVHAVWREIAGDRLEFLGIGLKPEANQLTGRNDARDFWIPITLVHNKLNSFQEFLKISMFFLEKIFAPHERGVLL